MKIDFDYWGSSKLKGYGLINVDYIFEYSLQTDLKSIFLYRIKRNKVINWLILCFITLH